MAGEEFIKALGPKVFERRIFQKDEVICRAGAAVDFVWLIVRGEAVLCGGCYGDTPFVKRVGSIYGDVEAILETPYLTNMTALDEVEVARIPADRILQEMRNASPMLAAMMKINATRILKDVRFIKSLSEQLEAARQLAQSYAANEPSEEGFMAGRLTSDGLCPPILQESTDADASSAP